ncbi:MAG: pyridoxal 5'-phosphate synthase glutaminase subunit PdxT [Deltaproteobacteria bacterium]|nr:pyridoxal 5'-phosphate synthase glutaminase subunit PdxT [Deltaproteobacteria bacterium]
MNIGVLALQGAVAPHREKISHLGADMTEVRLPADLEGLDGLILPGGESTTLLNLMAAYGLEESIRLFGRFRPVWGICAGAILLAQRVENPTQRSLGLLPATLQRNAYGRQNESFIEMLPLRLPGRETALVEGVFIRAPRIADIDSGGEVLARRGEEPVAVQFGHVLATTFHPELAADDHLHGYFLELCRKAGTLRAAG